MERGGGSIPDGHSCAHHRRFCRSLATTVNLAILSLAFLQANRQATMADDDANANVEAMKQGEQGQQQQGEEDASRSGDGSSTPAARTSSARKGGDKGGGELLQDAPADDDDDDDDEDSDGGNNEEGGDAQTAGFEGGDGDDEGDIEEVSSKVQYQTEVMKTRAMAVDDLMRKASQFSFRR